VDFPRVVEGLLGARAERVSPALFDRYLSELEARLPSPIGRRDLKIAYTPLHGLGFAPVTRALRARGFTAIHTVPEQAEPDGNFPTAPSPNPELPGTLDAVLALAARTGAELVLANDPDVDRLAAAAPLASGGYHVFTGNEVAVLLADFVLEQWPVGSAPLLVTSAVSTPLLGRIGAHYGAHVERTLTGFKWIWSAARALEASNRGRFAFGCEEALGYCVGPLVRDKDGISAAVWLAELAARELREGKSLVDRLHALYAQHGVWASAQRSLFRSGAHARASFRERIDALIGNPPGALCGESFRGGTDYRTGAESRPPWLGVSDLFELRYGSSTRVLVRPSGTEPKLKLYVDHEENPKQYATTEEAVRCARDRAEAIAETVLALLSE
jgi:phosphomannomutase